MVLCICLDNRNGISFNNRRQSADRKVYERILSLADGATVWIRPYSMQKFPLDRVKVTDDFADITEPNAWCFAEDGSILPLLERFDQLRIYRWNRDYPYDVVFPQHCLDMYRLSKITDFPGNSHNNITEELYVK